LPVSSVIPLVIRRFGSQNTEKPAGEIVSAKTYNENTNKKKSINFPLATKRAGNLRTRARYKKTMLSERKHWGEKLVL
jgi:hypothetical protein